MRTEFFFFRPQYIRKTNRGHWLFREIAISCDISSKLNVMKKSLKGNGTYIFELLDKISVVPMEINFIE